MRKLVFVLLITLALPVTASVSLSSFTAYAGHTVGSGEACFPCGCGNGCACDSGEKPGPCGNRATNLNGTQVEAPPSDSGTGIMTAVFMLIFIYMFLRR
jgi:hypothetical protein